MSRQRKRRTTKCIELVYKTYDKAFAERCAFQKEIVDSTLDSDGTSRLLYPKESYVFKPNKIRQILVDTLICMDRDGCVC